MVPMKQSCEFVRSIRYKLRMMDIPVDEASFMFGDKKYVLTNTANPGSTIKKKSQSICFHFICEGCDHDEWRTAYVKTCENIADLLTKPFLTGRNVGTL